MIRALQTLKEPCIVELYSDSKYVIDALSKGWAKEKELSGDRLMVQGRRGHGHGIAIIELIPHIPLPGEQVRVGIPFFLRQRCHRDPGPLRGPRRAHPLGQGPRRQPLQRALRPPGGQRVAEAERHTGLLQSLEGPDHPGELHAVVGGIFLAAAHLLSAWVNRRSFR